jgi:ADP-ribose pyrophosphatase YjhB (NUDIX family)
MSKATYRPPLPEVKVVTMEKDQFELMLLVARAKYEHQGKGTSTNSTKDRVL